MKRHMVELTMAALGRYGVVRALVFLAMGTSPVSAATLTRSVDVNATPAAVWSVVGPFCAIKDWLPPVGTCSEDGKNPPTRTLVTKDGKATFVELQIERDDREHTYSYAFTSSPLPVTNYTSTIKVVAKGDSASTVTWTGSYMPLQNKEKDASETLAGIYDSGLAAIKARFAK